MNQDEWQVRPEEELLDHPGYPEDEARPQHVHFERFDHEGLFEMPFWLRITLLLLALGLILIVSWSSSSGIFSFGQSDTEYVSAERSGGLEYRSRAEAPRSAPVANERDEVWFHSNRANIRFPVPDGWRQLDPEVVDLPIGVDNPRFVFVDTQAGCAFAAATLDQSLDAYVYTSSVDQLSSPEGQFRGGWYTDQSYHQVPLRYFGETRQYLSHELLMYQKGDTPDLLLWQLERNAVPNSCVGDVRTIIEAIEPHLLERRFERHHTGYISTRSVRIGGPDGPSRRALLFTDRNNGNTYQLQTLPNPVGNNRMFLADDALYYIGAAQESSPMNQDIPSIYRYELTSDTLTETFRVKHDENPVISSYYVADGWLYYLSGPTSSKWCLSKPSSGCGLDFYRAPLDALYDIELIATSTDAVSIYGYDPQFDILYLSNGYGDAGCLTHGILVFDGESIAPAAFYGVCKGDPEYVVYQTEMETLQASFEAEVAPSIFHRSGEYDASEWDPDWKSATFYLVPGSGEEAAVRDSSSTRTKTLIAQ